MTSKLFALLSIVLLVATTGCATQLKISEANRGVESTNGLVVNKRRVYMVQDFTVGTATTPGGQKIVGADPSRVLIVDVRRDVFASGGLKFGLTSAQTLKSVTVNSTPGTAAAAQGVTEIINARDKIGGE